MPTRKDITPQTTDAYYVLYQKPDRFVVQSGAPTPIPFVKADFYDIPEPEVIKSVAAGKALVLIIYAHSDSKGNITLIKDSGLTTISIVRAALFLVVGHVPDAVLLSLEENPFISVVSSTVDTSGPQRMSPTFTPAFCPMPRACRACAITASIFCASVCASV